MAQDNPNEQPSSQTPPKRKRSLWKRFKHTMCFLRHNDPKVPEDTPQLDDKFNEVFEIWSKQHHVDNGQQHKSHKASELLIAQLESYERELEQRKLEMTGQTSSIAVSSDPKHHKKKKIKRHKLADTDDKLPYELTPISNLKPGSSPKNSLRKDATESGSSDTSTGELEKGGHIADLLVEILEEAHGENVETVADLPGKTLAEMSRNDMAKFEHLIVEHTKECLFLSLPTDAELENWEWEEARAGNMEKRKNVIKFVKLNLVDVKKFCPDCKPRHWRTPCSNR